MLVEASEPPSAFDKLLSGLDPGVHAQTGTVSLELALERTRAALTVASKVSLFRFEMQQLASTWVPGETSNVESLLRTVEGKTLVRGLAYRPVSPVDAAIAASCEALLAVIAADNAVRLFRRHLSIRESCEAALNHGSRAFRFAGLSLLPVATFNDVVGRSWVNAQMGELCRSHDFVSRRLLGRSCRMAEL